MLLLNGTFAANAHDDYCFSKGEEIISNWLPRVRRIFLEHIHVHDRHFEEFLVSQASAGNSIKRDKP